MSCHSGLAWLLLLLASPALPEPRDSSMFSSTAELAGLARLEREAVTRATGLAAALNRQIDLIDTLGVVNNVMHAHYHHQDPPTTSISHS